MSWVRRILIGLVVFILVLVLALGALVAGLFGGPFAAYLGEEAEHPSVAEMLPGAFDLSHMDRT